MNGAVLLLSSYVFLTCTGTSLHFTTWQERLDFPSDTGTAQSPEDKGHLEDLSVH